MKCPCCGAGAQPEFKTYEFPGLTIDQGTGQVTYQGKTVRLTIRKTLILDIIAAAWPKFCRQDSLKKLLNDMARDDGIASAGNNLAVHMSHLRSIIQGLGLGIETRYTEGYQLNTNPGMRMTELWSDEDRRDLIERRNQGTSWQDLGDRFGCSPGTARGVAKHAATKLNLPLLSGAKIRSRGLGNKVRSRH